MHFGVGLAQQWENTHREGIDDVVQREIFSDFNYNIRKQSSRSANIDRNKCLLMTVSYFIKGMEFIENVCKGLSVGVHKQGSILFQDLTFMPERGQNSQLFQSTSQCGKEAALH